MTPSDPTWNVEGIRTVAVLGAGTMGNGIAHTFARSGFAVVLRDVDKPVLDRAVDTISTNLDREIKRGKLAQADKLNILARIQPVSDISAISDADFAIEAVPEKIALKREVLAEAGRVL